MRKLTTDGLTTEDGQRVITIVHLSLRFWCTKIISVEHPIARFLSHFTTHMGIQCKIQKNWCTVTVAPTIEHHGGHSRTPANQRRDQVPGRSQRTYSHLKPPCPHNGFSYINKTIKQFSDQKYLNALLYYKLYFSCTFNAFGLVVLSCSLFPLHCLILLKDIWSSQV